METVALPKGVLLEIKIQPNIHKLKQVSGLTPQESLEYKRMWYLANREEINRRKIWQRRLNPERYILYRKQWFERNRYRLKQRYKNYWIKNKERFSEKRRKWRQNNSETVRLLSKKWFEENPSKRAEYQNKRRALEYLARDSVQSCSSKI